MIGWWEDIIPIRTVRKKRRDMVKLQITREEFSSSKLTTQMQSKFHIFYWLLDIIRHGKDEFITKYGDLVSLDLDRANFESSSLITSYSTSYTWCFTCYIDKSSYDILHAIGPDKPVTNRLGALLKQLLGDKDFWNDNIASVLDSRVAMLLQCMEQCIRSYGKENVILDEPASMSAEELIEYFVTHSEYKDRNGKRGP